MNAVNYCEIIVWEVNGHRLDNPCNIQFTCTCSDLDKTLPKFKEGPAKIVGGAANVYM